MRRQEITQTGRMSQKALIQEGRREWVVRGQRATLAALPKGKPAAPREVQPQQLLCSRAGPVASYLTCQLWYLVRFPGGLG